ncbi:hypothetical protein NLJ89_g10610 [Agrocybe chaxingu]|uniref:Uncharacterized protein n=1 Tax=Agrocybe chaxingu TaxID=84603 RepID=A0A9W8JRE8_9AGAR|nr:hypothetical protein NLJ89_g10610 [Agrocybe chaxingu]
MSSAPPSSCSSKPAHKSHSRLRNRLLWTDQRSIVTGTPAAHIQVVHLINAIRHCSKNPEKAQVREDIFAQELVCKRQEFSGKNAVFGLNGPANAILLEPSFQIDLQQYALWCLTVPEQQLKELDQKLKSDNKEWAERVKTNPTAKRNLDTSQPPYVVGRLKVLVLSISVPFPSSRTIIVILRLKVVSIISQQIANNRVFQNALEIAIQDNRDPGERLSIFALDNGTHGPPPLAEILQNAINFNYYDLTLRVIGEIFYVPPGLSVAQWSSLEGSVPVADPESNLDNLPIPKPHDFPTGAPSGPKSSDQFSPSACSSTVHQCSDYGSEDYESDQSSSENDDGLINGLTHTEMRTATQYTGDGSLSGA